MSAAKAIETALQRVRQRQFAGVIALKVLCERRYGRQEAEIVLCGPVDTGLATEVWIEGGRVRLSDRRPQP